MDKKSAEKDYSDNNDQPITLYQKIYGIVRSNWLAFLCALFIAVLTIIVVPIIYTLPEPTNINNSTTLSWDISGHTIINKTNFVNNVINNSIGIISSISFDSQDNLYLLDKTFNRLLKYVAESNSLSSVFNQLNINGQPYSLSSPNDFYIDSDNEIYIADTWNHRIVLYQLDSQQASFIFGTGTPGSNSTELDQPMSLTMDGSSNIYIADYGNNRVILYNLTTQLATVIIPTHFDSNNRESYVLTPISIKYDSGKHSLVIAQETGFNLIRWILSPNTNVWTLIAGSASSQLNGTSRTLFNKLCSTNIDSYGHIYANDCNNQRIQYYLDDMLQGHTIAGVIQAQGNNSYTFKQPSAMALDSLYNLYVADSLNYRIQRFEQLH